MPTIKTSAPTLSTITGTTFSSTLNNVVGRVADLATLDFFFKRNSQNPTPERIVDVKPVDDIQGPKFAILQNPWLIGGVVIAGLALIVLVVRK